MEVSYSTFDETLFALSFIPFKFDPVEFHPYFDSLVELCLLQNYSSVPKAYIQSVCTMS